MARTIAEIRNILLAEKAAQSTLDSLNSTSNVAVWKLIFDIVAAAIWTLEKLYDIFTGQVNEIIATLKPHSARWYATKAEAFMFGFDLIDETDTYDTSNLTDADINAAKIIAFAAVVDQDRGIRIKVAKLVADELTLLTAPELLAFKEYMERVKDAGVKLLITSGTADSLKLSLQVYFNPLVLNISGERLDGTDTQPVQKAVKTYLKNLPFNGVFVTEYMVDALQLVDGVVIPHIMLASARYGVLPYTSFAVKYTPDAGYLRIIDDADLTIEFIAQSVI